jgi:hypothetical protein
VVKSRLASGMVTEEKATGEVVPGR